MVAPSPDPRTSLFAFMAYYLRFLRMQHKQTQAQVAEILGCSVSQVSKYETGAKQLGGFECGKLDEAWQTGGLFSIMFGYAKLGLDPNWAALRDKYQRSTTEHYLFSENLIPLPFQTEDYARGLLEAGHAAGFIEDVEEAVRQRMDLQTAMLDGRPYIWAVLDQIALRAMGSPDVMIAQQKWLLELGRLSHVSIRILPFTAAPHIGVDGSFHCFVMPERRMAAFSGGALGVGKVIDDQAEAAEVLVRFHQISARAWSEDQSREHIAGMDGHHDGLA